MGNSEKVNKEIVVDKFKDIKEIIINEFKDIINIRYKILNYIDDTYQQTYFKNSYDIDKWKSKIQNYINYIFEGKDNEIENILITRGIISPEKSKKAVYEKKKQYNKKKEESYEYLQNDNIIKLDVFTSKDIQNSILSITREFEEFSTNFINDDDAIENKTLGEFLLDIANISRQSYNESNKFLKILYNEFEKTKKKEEQIVISSLDQIKQYFSHWVKDNKNKCLINSLFSNFLNKILIRYSKGSKEEIKKNYLQKLFKDLLILYYQSELSFPPIEITFPNEEGKDFIAKKMIDCFDQKIEKKKVNFVFFPSFTSNGIYLENGKEWVFTYKEKKTFYFPELHLIPLDKTDRFSIPNLEDIINFEIIEEKYLVPKTNFRIIEGINYEYQFHIKNKKNENSIIKTNTNYKLKKNEEFKKCDFILMNKCIVSFNFPEDTKNS